MRFQRFLIESNPLPKIIMLQCDAKSQTTMERWCAKHGFDLTKSFSGKDQPPSDFDFHLTLFASRNGIDMPTGHFPIDPITERGVKFEALGKEFDTPVLSFVPAGPLRWLREEMIALTDAEPTFPDFKPHVSLSYNWTGTPDLNHLPLPPDLTFDSVKIVDFDLKEGILRAHGPYGGRYNVIHNPTSWGEVLSVMDSDSRGSAKCIMSRDQKHIVVWPYESMYVHRNMAEIMGKQLGVTFDDTYDCVLHTEGRRVRVITYWLDTDSFRRTALGRLMPRHSAFVDDLIKT